MTAVLAPFGLRPVFHPSGLVRSQAYSETTGLQLIASGSGGPFYQNQPVQIDTNGRLVAAANGTRMMGSVDGFEWTDTDGRRRLSNRWVQNQTFIAGSLVAYIFTDPNIIYEIQAANGASGAAALAQAALMEEYNFLAGTIAAGNATTGIASAQLDTATAVGAGAQGMLQLVDMAAGVDNALTDTYPIVRVRIARHQLVALNPAT